MRLVEHQMWKAYERGHSEFIPIYISLAECIDPYNCIEELLKSTIANPMTYHSMKNLEDANFLFLLDGFDELKSPKNLWVTNRLSEWKGNVKIVITTRPDYLKAHKNY